VSHRPRCLCSIHSRAGWFKAPGHVLALQAATGEARWLWLKDELTKYGNQAYWGMFPELAEFFRARPFVGAVA